MKKTYHYPFGQELHKVEQRDQNPKNVFVLGVYASAVHARWLDKEGRQKVAALAVASEPEIFWTGENAADIISNINIPKELGTLIVPAIKNLNGPSGRALDNLFLKPLRENRDTSWLCDLLPESRVNHQQKKALDNKYSNIAKQFGLIESNIPNFDKAELNSSTRREEILEELEKSKAETIILLGDLPIYWFIRFHDKRFSKLSQFGNTSSTYGLEHEIKINNKAYNVIPLCHPRQAARLGISSGKWGKAHDEWIQDRMGKD